jgi:CubicO group peptidase (beta-lactamase class C family)
LLLLNETFEAGGRVVPLNGGYDRKFQNVVEAFRENYGKEDEVGSAVSVVVDGRTVVDVWGGWKESQRRHEWQPDTIVCMMSVAKGITGIAFNMLVDRGLIDVNAPIAKYWPEFAQNGKEKLPVRYALDHRAALPVVLDPMWPGAIFDRVATCNAIAAQAPLWEPGTTAAYHIHTQGFILGEIMRRVSGKTVGEFLRDEIAGPLGADYLLANMSERDQARCAELIPNMDAKLLAAREVDKDNLLGKAFTQMPAKTWAENMNSRLWREGEIASGSAHGNARGVARIYGAVARGGEVDGVRLASRASIEAMIQEQHNQVEIMQQRPYRQALGILLNTPAAVFMGPNPRSFGHHGLGGSIGFGDPDARIGFSYCCNKMHSVGTNGPRAARLIEAVYSAL